LKYRPEIDGLRAIAVMPVVLFHFDLMGFRGGYLGVDIFFVISGYLITSIIEKEIHAGSFSILNFYERRIRRILPALIFVAGVTTVVSWTVFDPNALANFGSSLVATTIFSSNLYFWADAGYFSSPALEKPLLHTWSLSIEEQFYIFFPILLLLIHKVAQRLKPYILVSLWLASFLLCIYGDFHHPDATFYLLPTRAWELLSGSLLAINLLPKIKSIRMSGAIALLGCLFIALGIIHAGGADPSRVYFGVLPVFGSLMVIHANTNSKTLVCKILSNPFFVKVGLISYSLYLWHWPVDVMAKYLIIRPLADTDKILLVFLSFGLAFCSWKFIEKPFRQKGKLFPRRKVLFGATLTTMFLTSATGAWINLQDGMTRRNPLGGEILAQAQWEWHVHGNQPLYCNLEIEPGFSQPGRCGVADQLPEIALWGDSHAMAWVPGLDKIAKEHGKSVLIFTHRSYPPILGYDQFRSSIDTNALSREVLSSISQDKSIKTVVLAAAWFDYFHLYKVPRDIDGEITFGMAKQGLHEVVGELDRLGKKIIVMADIPWLKDTEYTVRSFYLHSIFPDAYDIRQLVPSPSLEEYLYMNKRILSVFQELKQKSGVEILHVYQNFFQNGEDCLLHVNKVPIYRDSGHLSTFGSRHFSYVFDTIFNDMVILENPAI
jgi:peptidoglycan/LPS O-acetylase OafA/YrhL